MMMLVMRAPFITPNKKPPILSNMPRCIASTNLLIICPRKRIKTTKSINVTIKAMNDSAVFNPDSYRNFMRKILGVVEFRNIQPKEVIINDISNEIALSRLEELQNMSASYINKYKRTQHYFEYWLKGYDMQALVELSKYLDTTVDYLTDCKDRLVVNKLMDFPILRRLWVYRPTERKWLGMVFAIFLPFGLPIYLIGLSQQKRLKHELRTIIDVCGKLKEMIK